MSPPLIPFKTMTFVTDKSMGEVIRLLHKNVDIRWSNASLWEKMVGTAGVSFYGEIEHNLFSIKRKTTLGSGLRVVLRGSIRETENKTLIDVEFRFDILTIGFLSLSGLLCLITFVSSAFSDDDMFMTIGSAFTMLFFYFMVMGSFLWESWRIRRRFLEMIRGDIHNPRE